MGDLFPPERDGGMVLPDLVTAGSVGDELRSLRQMRGLSQKDLAEAVGVAAGQVSQIETGRYVPSLVTLGRILNVLEAHLEIELNEGGLFTGVPSEPECPPASEAR
ncbi:MAG: helix-turn-helix transcriptional regulator [Patescibacteria group bacterium]|nr:helix-turn-helix transcriptional regulator [Patescibacteria group bacterium]